MKCQCWWETSVTLIIVLSIICFSSTFGRALPQSSSQPNTPHPAMIAVSSTVIPVSNVKEPSARQASSNYYFSRRFRFFDKSSKPDEPIRLITKKSSLKALMEPSKTS